MKETLKWIEESGLLSIIKGIFIGSVLLAFGLTLRSERLEDTVVEIGQAAVQKMEERRFFIPDANTGALEIIVDRETGVCYCWRKYMNAGGLTVMLDADGKPVIWKEDER